MLVVFADCGEQKRLFCLEGGVLYHTVVIYMMMVS